MIPNNSTKPGTSRTFAVADVGPTDYKLSQVAYEDALASRVLADGGHLEAYSRDTSTLVKEYTHNAFIEAAMHAYGYHRPLVLSPDAVWLQIAQGFAQHVGLHAEELRSKFVAHTGQHKLLVERDDFIRGFAGNDWEGAIGEFSDQIRDHVGKDRHRLMVPTFSTTGFVERAAFEVTLMDAMQHYFEYEIQIICGIPEITLEGTVDDWQAIRERAAAFDEFGMDWWTVHLLPVLDQFVAASQGDVHKRFWECFYRIDFGCGPDVNGHILNFVPYLVEYGRSEDDTWRINSTGLKRNPLLGQSTEALWVKQSFAGVGCRSIPPGLAKAPFKIIYGKTKYEMDFVAGFVGVREDPDTLALRPEIGWAVVEKGLAQ